MIIRDVNSQPHFLASGRIEHIEAFPSKYIAGHTVDVWLPDNYSKERRYPVLYMQDGQMLFDSTVTWNKTEWQADEILGKLIKMGEIKECILVAIWNSGAGRHSDYLPQKPFESLTENEQDSLYNSSRLGGASVFNGQKIHSGNYLQFIVKELKPYIDKSYSTLRDKSTTFIGGSSMGALLSLYAICEYPRVFGGAICMSTHWTGIFTLEHNPLPAAFFAYLRLHLPSAKDHKIYFDHGDKTLDAWYPSFQKQADIIMKQKGYANGKNWLTLVFPGEDHSERAWARRFAVPLKFLIGK